MTAALLSDVLWRHQVDAIDHISGYLADSSRAQDEAALITMPTGTGKTAVIAGAIAAQADLNKHFLIAAPWTSIVDQLTRALSGGIWDSLDVAPPIDFPRVAPLPAAKDIDTLQTTAEPTVFVATIDLLLSINREIGSDAERRQRCFGNFRALFIDEGHYEPAAKWSQALRTLGLSTVLLTATPYRNDEKYFTIARGHRFRYSHDDAVAGNYLRTPKFVVEDSDQFVERLVEFTKAHVSDDSRVIVRCADASTISGIVTALISLGETAIGLHHSFTGKRPHLSDRVPAPADCTATYWVHQHKLIEGIDDPRFRVLAIHDGLGSDRATIQQIGRILRNPQRSDTDTTGWVFARNQTPHRSWNAYVAHERAGGESSATVPELAQRMLASQPTSVYFDGSFRQPVDLTDPMLTTQMRFVLATRVYQLPSQGFPPLGEVVKTVADEWGSLDRLVFEPQTPDGVAVIPYVAIRNSPFLARGAFVEAVFGYTAIWMSATRLYVFDAHGRTPAVVDDLKLETPSRLAKLLAGSSRLTAISLDNTDLSRNAIRARTFRAASIAEVASELTDYTYLCSVAEGYPNTATRRYLGLSRSRVRDSTKSEGTYTAYQKWLQEIDRALSGAAVPAATFDRYAQVVDAPADPAAKHVLLDVSLDDFRTSQTDVTQMLDLDDLASEVKAGSFDVVVAGVRFPVTISWLPGQERYEVASKDLQALDFREIGGNERELVASINADQSLRIVTKTKGVLYANGSFSRPIRPGTGGRPFPLLDIITAIDDLGADAAGSEKGTPTQGDDWSSGSVFEIIDRLRGGVGPTAPEAMSGLLEPLDMLLCTDLQTEIADFVAVTSDRVVLMHAKASGKSKQLSASAFHDVAGQATKNLLWLQPQGGADPMNAYWDQAWSVNLPVARGSKTTQQSNVARLRRGTYPTAADKWGRIREAVTDPNVSREVWLVMGRSLSRDKLNAAARSRTQPPEFIQIYALLQSTWSTISQAGARLRIFCSP